MAKELVENSIDAGSSRIELEFTGGGIASLSVRDNGCGMAPEDAVLAFTRHATSKISQAADLEHVLTLGFRGEALASIGAVARVTLVTCEAGSVEGVRVVVAGGKLLHNERTGCPTGTRVLVEDLFYNVMPRRQFLKSQAVETRAVMETFGGLALARPDIAFTGLRDGQIFAQTPGRGDLQAAVAGILGLSVADQLLPVEGESPIGRIWGYISPPGLHRPTRKQQYFFINGRWIRHYRLAAVAEEAYATLLPGGRHPLLVLHLLLNPALVDVNIHPAKLEVRFRQEEEILALVRQALGAALRRPGAGPFLVKETGVAPGSRPAGSFHGEVGPATGRSMAESLSHAHRKSGPGVLRRQDQAGRSLTGVEQRSLKLLYAPGTDTSEEAGSSLDRENTAQLPPGLELLGQAAGTYIVLASDRELWLVDQHAAHERIRYERLARAGTRPWPSQELAVARPLDLAADQALLVAQYLDLLSGWGFRLEEVGPRTYWLRGQPLEVAPEAGWQLLLDILELLEQGLHPAVHDEVYKLVACRGAVKAGDRLSREEMAALIRDLEGTTAPFTCPHGRPAVHKLSLEELAKKFGR